MKIQVSVAFRMVTILVQQDAKLHYNFDSLPNAPHFVLGPLMCGETSFALRVSCSHNILKVVVVAAAFLRA
jgi:hypothetical protein